METLLAQRSVAWQSGAWRGVVGGVCGVVWCGVAWHGVVERAVAWISMVWRGRRGVPCGCESQMGRRCSLLPSLSAAQPGPSIRCGHLGLSQGSCPSFCLAAPCPACLAKAHPAISELHGGHPAGAPLRKRFRFPSRWRGPPSWIH